MEQRHRHSGARVQQCEIGVGVAVRIGAGGVVWDMTCETAALKAVARAWERDTSEDGEVSTGGCDGCGIGQTPAQLYGGPHMIDKERNIRSIRFQLTGRTGGNDRTLPPGVWSTTERSKTPQVTTGRVWCHMIRCSTESGRS